MPILRFLVALFLSFGISLSDTNLLHFMQKHLCKQKVTVVSKGICSKLFKSCQIIISMEASILT